MINCIHLFSFTLHDKFWIKDFSLNILNNENQIFNNLSESEKLI